MYNLVSLRLTFIGQVINKAFDHVLMRELVKPLAGTRSTSRQRVMETVDAYVKTMEWLLLGTGQYS